MKRSREAPTTPEKTANRRVLVVTPQPFYEDRGTPIAVRYLLIALSELGYEVDLLAFPVGSTIELPGLSIFRTANPLAIKSVPIGFSWRKLSLDAMLLAQLRERLNSNDYCYVHAVEEAAYLLTILQSTGMSLPPLLYDMASSIPEQLRLNYLLGLKPAQAILEALETRTIDKAAYVLCSGGLQAHVESLSAETPVSEWWFPTMQHQVSEPSEKNALLRSLGIDANQTLFVYTGSFATYQGIAVLLQAIQLLCENRHDFHFLLVGANTLEIATMESKLSGPATSRITMLERQPHDQISRYFELADVLVSTRMFGANTPLKIFDYMGAGKPIIASDIPAHRATLDEERAVFFDNSPTAMAAAIETLLDHPENRERLSKNSMRYARDYLTWNRFRDQIKGIVEHLQGNSSTPARKLATDFHSNQANSNEALMLKVCPEQGEQP